MNDIQMLTYRLIDQAEWQNSERGSVINTDVLREAAAALARLERERDELREALERMLLATSGEEGAGLDEAKEAARTALEAKP